MSAAKKVPAYLEEEINKIAKAEGFVNYEFKFESGSNHGDGFVGDLASVEIVGNRKVDGKLVQTFLPLMCKMLPEGEVTRKQYQTQRIFEREVYVYNNVLPVFTKFQNDKNIPEEDKFTNFPKSYYAISDDATNKHVIIMENLKTAGYTLWDKFTPMNIENVTILMKELGKLHGLSLAIRDQNPKLYEHLKESLPDLMLSMLKSKENPFEKMLQQAYDQAISVLVNKEEIEILKRFKNNFFQEFEDCLAENVAEPFAVLNHGDCWNNNMMFKKKANNKICLLDWQITCSNSPALDLSYFLLSSTNSELRKNYKDVLKVYHDSLSNIITKLGSDPEKLLTFKDLENQMTKFGKYGLLMAPVLLQVMVSDPKNIKSLDDFAADDVKLATLDEDSIKIYRERIGGAIRDAINLNFV